MSKLQFLVGALCVSAAAASPRARNQQRELVGDILGGVLPGSKMSAPAYAEAPSYGASSTPAAPVYGDSSAPAAPAYEDTSSAAAPAYTPTSAPSIPAYQAPSSSPVAPAYSSESASAAPAWSSAPAYSSAWSHNIPVYSSSSCPVSVSTVTTTQTQKPATQISYITVTETQKASTVLSTDFEYSTVYNVHTSVVTAPGKCHWSSSRICSDRSLGTTSTAWETRVEDVTVTQVSTAPGEPRAPPSLSLPF